jgi:carbamoyl-phosphate synthase large subunit
MQRIHDVGELDAYIRGLMVSRRPSHDARESPVGWPLLIDEFLADAIELDVDVLCDQTGHAVVCGVMEHIEEAGIHSGDSACSIPPYSLDDTVVTEVMRQARVLAQQLGVVGFMNVQFAHRDDRIYVLEVNPRASRTVPFVSKAMGAQLAKIATRLMLGRTLAELEIRERVPACVSVKEVVLPFIKFDGVDPVLGPEMRSTGEVMGIDGDFARAFAKSQLAAGNELPSSGAVLVRDAVLAIDFVELGFSIVDDVDAIARHEVQLVIAIGDDARHLRQAAVRRGVSYLTTVRAVRAALAAIRAVRERPLGVRSLQLQSP